MDAPSDCYGLYLGLDEADDDALELDSFLNLPQSSQPASQSNAMPGPSIAAHSVMRPTPGPATVVDGVPVQDS